MSDVIGLGYIGFAVSDLDRCMVGSVPPDHVLRGPLSVLFDLLIGRALHVMGS